MVRVRNVKERERGREREGREGCLTINDKLQRLVNLLLHQLKGVYNDFDKFTQIYSFRTVFRIYKSFKFNDIMSL